MKHISHTNSIQNFHFENIIFFDTEFTHLDVEVGELLSIGLVKQTGEELYLELEYSGKKIHPWVKKKVLPYLLGDTVTKKTARKKLRDFFIPRGEALRGKSKKKGERAPYLMSYVNQFDAIFWYKLFGDPKKHPAFWIPLDFASILFAYGYDPESMRQDSFFTELGIDKSKFKLHNALEDAKMLKEVYEKIRF
ncbi:MAG: hypothetical protein HYV41_00010 [Candidatus Magasanikbacteria bacterium]|nr:hypothetical protein [Candidatus Magasanikbacteria bacterium]